MDNDKSTLIFTTSVKSEMDRAADYLKECRIEFLVKEKGTSSLFGSNDPTSDGYELWILEKDEKKVFSLLEEILPQYFSEEEAELVEENAEAAGDTAVEDDNEEEEEEGASLLAISIIGKLLIILSAGAGIIGFFFKVPYFKMGTIVLASLSILVNGYEGFKSQKALATILCILSIFILLFGIFYPATNLKTLMNTALTHLNRREFNQALPLYEKALTAAKQEKSIESEVFILSYMANIYNEKSLPAKALEYYNQALEKADEAGYDFLKQIIEPEIQRIKDENGLE